MTEGIMSKNDGAFSSYLIADALLIVKEILVPLDFFSMLNSCNFFSDELIENDSGKVIE